MNKKISSPEVEDISFNTTELFTVLSVESEEAIRALGEQLYLDHYATLYRYLYARLHSKYDAEDLAQTVFVKAYTSLKKGLWDGGGDIYYLFTIARNTLIDYFRRNRHTPIASDELIAGLTDTVITSAPGEEREQREYMSGVLDKLRPSEGKAVEFRFFNDMEYREIAEKMHKREEAVRQLVHRGLKSMREYLQQEEMFA